MRLFCKIMFFLDGGVILKNWSMNIAQFISSTGTSIEQSTCRELLKKCAQKWINIEIFTINSREGTINYLCQT